MQISFNHVYSLKQCIPSTLLLEYIVENKTFENEKVLTISY